MKKLFFLLIFASAVSLAPNIWAGSDYCEKHPDNQVCYDYEARVSSDGNGIISLDERGLAEWADQLACCDAIDRYESISCNGKKWKPLFFCIRSLIKATGNVKSLCEVNPRIDSGAKNCEYADLQIECRSIHRNSAPSPKDGDAEEVLGNEPLPELCEYEGWESRF